LLNAALAHRNRNPPKSQTCLLAAMFPTLLAVAQIWYALPLIVSISLVYAATRHELVGPILQHAVRLGIWIIAFMGVVFAILVLLSLGAR
jgi:hypothetical protein